MNDKKNPPKGRIIPSKTSSVPAKDGQYVVVDAKSGRKAGTEITINKNGEIKFHGPRPAPPFPPKK